MKLGNLIYKGDLINHDFVDYINYYNMESSDIDSILLNLNKLPTLVVGYSLFKKIYGEKFPDQSILDKRVIPNNLYWEFSFAENKKQCIDGVDLFVNKNLVSYYFFDFKYQNIDPIYNQIGTEEEFVNQFNNIECTYVDLRMLYFISNNIIYGLDCDVFDFYGYNINFLKNVILEKSIKKVIDLDNSKYRSYYKQFPELEFLKRYIPLFELVK